MHGVMAPPERYSSQPLMLAAAAPLHAPRGLMSVEAGLFADFNLHEELTRLLWAAAAVLSIVLYVGSIAAR